MWNSRVFSHVYDNDNTSTCPELKAVAKYFYGNQIMLVFNKLSAFESTALLKLLKPRSWLPVPNCKAIIMASRTEAVNMMKVICRQSPLNLNINPSCFWQLVTALYHNCVKLIWVDGVCCQIWHMKYCLF